MCLNLLSFITLYWGYLIILCIYHLGVSCTGVVLTCFVMCRCVCVCECFGNVWTCIYCVLYCLYCVVLCFCIISFMYIYSYLFCLHLVWGVLPPSENSIAINSSNSSSSSSSSSSNWCRMWHHNLGKWNVLLVQSVNFLLQFLFGGLSAPWKLYSSC